MKLSMEINNVKSIKYLNFEFPLEKGLYAITGENASGKSTVVACASTVFFQMSMYDYFGRPDEKASIKFNLDGATRTWNYENKRWIQDTSFQKMKLNGFYEGSIMFGNRFKDTNFSMIHILDDVNNSEIDLANDFVKENMGLILHDNKNYYKDVFVLKKEAARIRNLSKSTYFYKTLSGKMISQARMSTGENLLVSILNSLDIVRNKRMLRNDGRPCIVFLDEIELALHASALRRLVHFLAQISEEYDLTIFFSTHSLELIRGIKPQNIYYLERRFDNTIAVTNPCYPAYATRNLYSDDGYGEDMVIFVEDDVAKCIVDRILYEKDLLQNVRIKVLPTGGWTNTIVMAYDVISSGILLKNTKLALILDRDIQKDVPNFMSNHKKYRHLKPDYLPISSLEKYLKDKLIVKVDNQLYSKLDNYLFQKRPLSVILNKYKSESKVSEDTDGKSLYGFLINELSSVRKDREDLVDVIVKYLLDNDREMIDSLAEYLRKKIAE